MDAERGAFCARTQAALEAFYLADPPDPYRQSGRSKGARRGEETRRCIADGVSLAWIDF